MSLQRAQEDGWPLGLQPLNVRIGVARNVDSSGSISFNTLISSSPTSSMDSSSDLATESTGSFFHDARITLGSLIGITSLLELSSRSFRSRRVLQQPERNRKNSQKKPMIRFFISLCSARAPVDSEAAAIAADGKMPSLGHFLELERGANGAHRRNRVSIIYELEGAAESQLVPEPNAPFSNGCVALAPQDGGDETRAWAGKDDEGGDRDPGHADGHVVPVSMYGGLLTGR